MKIDESGNYVDEGIDELISEAAAFRDTLHAILRRDPEIRESIMQASYKDFVTYKWVMCSLFNDLDRILSNKALDASIDEVTEAAGEHPALVD